MALLAPLKPDVVIIALSLGNEGLAHCPAGERRAAQHRFEQGRFCKALRKAFERLKKGLRMHLKRAEKDCWT